MSPPSSVVSAGLQRLLSSTDNHLVHLAHVFARPQGLESMLTTILFTCTLLHSQSTRLLEKQYSKLAVKLTQSASATKSELSNDQTLLTGLGPPTTYLSQACASLKSITILLEDFWIFSRLWGLVNIYIWGRQLWTKPPQDPIIKTLTWGQVWAGAVFQAIENVGYLASKGILRGVRFEKGWPRMLALGTRFWMVQVVLEGLRLGRVGQLRWREELGAEEVEEADEGETVEVQSEELKEKWQTGFAANAGWLPLTLHWSYEDPQSSPVPEVWRGVCGLLPSLIALQDIWRETV